MTGRGCACGTDRDNALSQLPAVMGGLQDPVWKANTIIAHFSLFEHEFQCVSIW